MLLPVELGVNQRPILLFTPASGELIFSVWRVFILVIVIELWIHVLKFFTSGFMELSDPIKDCPVLRAPDRLFMT